MGVTLRSRGGPPQSTRPTLPPGTDSPPSPSPLPLLAHTLELLKEKGGTSGLQIHSC